MVEDKKHLHPISNPTVAANFIPYLRMVARDANKSLSHIVIQAHGNGLFVHAGSSDLENGKVEEDGKTVDDFFFGLHCECEDRDVPLLNFHRDHGPVGTNVSRLGLPQGYEVVPSALMARLREIVGDGWNDIVEECRTKDDEGDPE